MLPTLNYNGGSQAVAATDWALLEALQVGTIPMPTGPGGSMQDEPIYTNTYLMQWDVSALGPITDFNLSFTGVQHAQLYALRLDQSDEYVPLGIFASAAAVPEPSSCIAMGLALAMAGAFWHWRRRR